MVTLDVYLNGKILDIYQFKKNELDPFKESKLRTAIYKKYGHKVVIIKEVKKK